MRSHDGQDYYTVGEVAAAVGVSPQTLRVWERKGLLIPARSNGRQRLYTEDHLRRARQIVHLRRRHGWNPAAIGSAASLEAAAQPMANRSVGLHIRAARLARERTLADLADQTGISSSFLYSVERGESGISVQLLSRLADALEMPMSGFASPCRAGARLVRPGDRPRTVLAGGITWEELVTPGQTLEPALLHVPPGQSSGGPLARPRDNFVFMLSGSLHFVLLDDNTEVEVREGDALSLVSGSTWSWYNAGAVEALCLWVEHLQAGIWEGVKPVMGPTS